MSVFLELKKYIDLLPIIDTHCHKMPSHKGFPEGIKDLVEHSYLGWCHCEWDGTREGAKQFVESLGHNSYFYWIEKSLQKLLKTEKRLTEETFLWFDEQIRMFTKGITSDDEFLKNECHYEKIILDGYWDPGTNLGNMKQMVEQINAQRPDVVVIAGDIFDNEYEALDDPEKLQEILSSIDSTYGVYACYGNHDIDEKILAGFTFEQKGKKQSDIRMDKFLKKCNIKLLRDEAVLIEDAFYLYGRPDYERPGRGIEKRKTPEEITEELDKSKPILVLDHEPRELQELAEAGVDLDLCGHTHDGQMFPGNLITSLSWENSCGYLKKGEMHNIVTSGVGVFGPNMRVGTKSEICGVEVRFLPE